jgi:hypothetical protein
VANMRYLTAHFVDHGFTAFSNYRRDTRVSLRDFITQYAVCELATLDMPFVKEGLPREDASEIIHTDIPTCLYSESIAQLPDGTTMEDIDQPEPDHYSLCSILARKGYARVDDLCRTCNEQQVFISASSTDYCLKEMGTVYYRDRLTSETAGDPYTEPYGGTDITGRSTVGVYSQDGYYSDLISGPIDVQAPQYEKVFDGLEVECIAEDTTRCELRLRVACSAQAVDPLDTYCGIVWKTQVINRWYLECQGMTQAQLNAAKARPNLTLGWPLFMRGRYLYVHLRIQNASGSAPVGGKSSFSRVSARLRI